MAAEARSVFFFFFLHDFKLKPNENIVGTAIGEAIPAQPVRVHFGLRVNITLLLTALFTPGGL